LPPGVIEGLIARENAEGLIDLKPAAFSFTTNQPLRITEGPFADLVGLFQSVGDNERVMLLLDLLGRPVRVQIPAVAVEAA
jgi:transcriptional antiterminator RfaH